MGKRRTLAHGRRWASAVAPLVACSALWPASAGAAPKTYEVNSTGDPVPGACTNADCTLREAFRAANAHAGPDVIEVRRNKTYAFTQAIADEDAALSGDLDSLGKLTLRAVGNGQGKAIIDANDFDRALDLFAPATLAGIEVRDGNVLGGTIDDGGGILAQAELTLNRSLVTSSMAVGQGDGIASLGAGSVKLVRSATTQNLHEGVYQEGSGGITLLRSSAIDNGNSGVSNVGGGGVRVIDSQVNGNDNQGVNNFSEGFTRIVGSEVNGNGNQGLNHFADGPVKVVRSEVSGNDNQGIDVFQGEGDVTITRSRVVESANQGISIETEGDVTITRTRVLRSDNQGIQSFGDGAFTVTRSLVKGGGNQGISSFGNGRFTLDRVRVVNSDNQGVESYGTGGTRILRTVVSGSGGSPGVYFDGDGFLLISRSEVTGGDFGGVQMSADVDDPLRIVQTTIAGNQGSGLEVDSAAGAIVTASTISGNHAADDGGGIRVDSGDLTVTRSTIAGNQANGDGGGISSSNLLNTVSLNGVTVARNVSNADDSVGGAGGGLFRLAGAFSVRNSLIVLNNQVSGDADECSGLFDSLGNNLLTELVDCTFGGPNDLVRPNPKVGALKANGGPTKTVALKGGSPAIGKAHKPSSTDRDQRGRKRDADPDIGAFER